MLLYLSWAVSSKRYALILAWAWVKKKEVNKHKGDIPVALNTAKTVRTLISYRKKGW
jgi:uncharacterized membrane protein YozB (DUF420 family)